VGTNSFAEFVAENMDQDDIKGHIVKYIGTKAKPE
jgi:hypothetical protein